MATATAPAAGLRRDATVISLVGFCHGTSHFFHFVLPTLFPWLMRDFGLTFTQVGATMTVFFVVGGIGLLALAALGIAVSQNLGMLFAAAAVAGLGNSVFHPADFTVLNRKVSTPRLGHAFSVHGLSGSLGWAAAPLFVLAIAEVSSWRTAALGASLVGFLALTFLILNRR